MVGVGMMRTKGRRCPVIIDLQGQLIKSQIFASEAEPPVEVSIKVRDKGWLPYRVRFDESQAAWIVSSQSPPDLKVLLRT